MEKSLNLFYSVLSQSSLIFLYRCIGGNTNRNDVLCTSYMIQGTPFYVHCV
jgi:hypothetical protein